MRFSPFGVESTALTAPLAGPHVTQAVPTFVTVELAERFRLFVELAGTVGSRCGGKVPLEEE